MSNETKMASLIAAASMSEDACNSPSSVKQVKDSSGGSFDGALQPYPFFYYKDFSQHKNPFPDAHNALKSSNTFPVKMYKILSDPQLQDTVAWVDHGRSWRILRPREFERRVIPAYFEHTKFSSFIRQANGWGFRRVMQGRDRGSYYHEKFLKGMPHLCRTMKRPQKAQKISIDTDHEPDLYKISELHPLPEPYSNEPHRRDSICSTGVIVPKPVHAVSVPVMPTSGSAFVIPQQIPNAGSPPSVVSMSPQSTTQLTSDLGAEVLVSTLKLCLEQANANAAIAPAAAPVVSLPVASTPAAPSGGTQDQQALKLLVQLIGSLHTPAPAAPAPLVVPQAPAPAPTAETLPLQAPAPPIQWNPRAPAPASTTAAMESLPTAPMVAQSNPDVVRALEAILVAAGGPSSSVAAALAGLNQR